MRLYDGMAWRRAVMTPGIALFYGKERNVSRFCIISASIASAWRVD